MAPSKSNVWGQGDINSVTDLSAHLQEAEILMSLQAMEKKLSISLKGHLA